MSDKKYYPILLEFVGRGSSVSDALKNRILLQDKPGRKNMSLMRCVKGYLGTTGDWSRTALGEMTEEETRDLLKSKGIDIPDEVSLRCTDYSFGSSSSEEWNQQFSYR